MTARAYHFTHAALVPARRDDVRAVLVDLEHYAHWWPQVRAVARLDDDSALVVCRSSLPYALELHLTAVRRDPDVLEVAVGGVLHGFARWQLTDLGDATRIDYLQEVRVRGWGLTAASYLARPVLRWNHAVMMRGCEAGLRTRLATG